MPLPLILCCGPRRIRRREKPDTAICKNLHYKTNIDLIRKAIFLYQHAIEGVT